MRRPTPRQLNRATLSRQMLLERAPIGVVAGVQRSMALQAQEPASPYVALWSRIARFDPADLDRAFLERALVRASLMRITLHAVSRDDYTTFHQAMVANLRASRLNDRRFTSTGLTTADADGALEALLGFCAVPRSKDEIESMLAEHLGVPSAEPRLWWALRTFAALMRSPAEGRWGFPVDIAYETAPADPPRPEAAVALQHLIRRYLEAFGPASAADFAQFSMQRQSAIRPALDAMADGLEIMEGPDGEVLLDLPGGVVPDEETPAPPRLLGMWDSILLAYRDRRRVIPDPYRHEVIRRNGDVLPTLLVDGWVAGVWRHAESGIEVAAFEDLDDATWSGVAAEARSLLKMIGDRDPEVYGRHRRWWGRLRLDGTRVLPA